MGTKETDTCSEEVDANVVEEEIESSSLELALEKLSLGSGRVTKNKKKKLLVLALNGFLIHRTHLANPSEIPAGRRPDATYNAGMRLVYKRPFLEEFIQFCLQRFEVALWSSAMERNLDGVLAGAFKGLEKKFLFVWDQSKCSDYGFKSLEKSDKPLLFKELAKVWQKSFSMRIGDRFSEADTLLIEDEPYKGLLNPPHTGIFPHPYDPEDVTDNILDPKGKLAKYLEGLLEAEDVPSYVKEHPFGQPAIAPGHPHWEFFNLVIRRAKSG